MLCQYWDCRNSLIVNSQHWTTSHRWNIAGWTGFHWGTGNCTWWGHHLLGWHRCGRTDSQPQGQHSNPEPAQHRWNWSLGERQILGSLHLHKIGLKLKNTVWIKGCKVHTRCSRNSGCQGFKWIQFLSCYHRQHHCDTQTVTCQINIINLRCFIGFSSNVKQNKVDILQEFCSEMWDGKMIRSASLLSWYQIRGSVTFNWLFKKDQIIHFLRQCCKTIMSL